MGKKPTVRLRVYKGQKMSYDEKGVAQNENQKVTLKHDTIEWKNYLVNLKANGFIKVDVEDVVYVDSKKNDAGFFEDVETLCEESLVNSIKKEVKQAFEEKKVELTDEQRRIAELEAKLEALVGSKTKENKEPIKQEVIDDDLESLKKEYEEVVGKKPHHMAKAETLKQAIEEAKQTV